MLRQLMLCLGTVLWISASTPFAIAATDTDSDMKIVESAALGTNPDLPWSEAVQIDGPFEGSFIGVFDRHSFHERFLNTDVRIEVQSLWTKDFIRVLSIVRDQDCLSQPSGVAVGRGCSEFSNARNITQLFIKIEDEVFQVSGEGSTFAVDENLAAALQTAPDDDVRIRLVSESGEIIDSEIGQVTVMAWDTVYGAGAIAETP
ncbi:hypothetical protein PN498_16690 [Oscillatoria sp. CS-180]|uniref:hypothetical protein n=1 Tax=Oscillatoria sp. CS-180 TaxID=3021720 RepID=UPI0023311BF5|nr:hypothetical protein [Oscillatoria sp. CS-180]MDB9527636.1 hypothetical protein [Oscillatoria sp. CS-180]